MPPRKTPEPDPSVDESPAAEPGAVHHGDVGRPRKRSRAERPVRIGDGARLRLEERVAVVRSEELQDPPDDGPSLRRHRADLAPEDRELERVTLEDTVVP